MTLRRRRHHFQSSKCLVGRTVRLERATQVATHIAICRVTGSSKGSRDVRCAMCIRSEKPGLATSPIRKDPETTRPAIPLPHCTCPAKHGGLRLEIAPTRAETSRAAISCVVYPVKHHGLDLVSGDYDAATRLAWRGLNCFNSQSRAREPYRDGFVRAAATSSSAPLTAVNASLAHTVAAPRRRADQWDEKPPADS
jgi:hypothetical protein